MALMTNAAYRHGLPTGIGTPEGTTASDQGGAPPMTHVALLTHATSTRASTTLGVSTAMQRETISGSTNAVCDVWHTPQIAILGSCQAPPHQRKCAVPILTLPQVASRSGECRAPLPPPPRQPSVAPGLPNARTASPMYMTIYARTSCT